MRRVPLDIVDLVGPSGNLLPKLHYSEALVLIAKVPQGGIGMDEMEMDRALAIEAAIASATKQESPAVLLEEADWSWLVEKIKANRWPFASCAYKTLIASVAAAERVDPNLKAA
jgi:hypothetical protein